VPAINPLSVFAAGDSLKNRSRNLLQRLLRYSFLFYLISAFQETTGMLWFPPHVGGVHLQLVPFRFLADWLALYQVRGADRLFWQSLKLTLYNVIMLLPLGIYLPLLCAVKDAKRAIGYRLLTSLTIETCFPLGFPARAHVRRRLVAEHPGRRGGLLRLPVRGDQAGAAGRRRKNPAC